MIFHSYVSLPEGNWWIFWIDPSISCWPRFLMFFARPFFVDPSSSQDAESRSPHALTVYLSGGSTVTPRGCAGEIPKNRWSQKWSPSIEFLYRKCRWHRQVPTNWPRRKCPEVGMGCRLWQKVVLLTAQCDDSRWRGNNQPDPSLQAKKIGLGEYKSWDITNQVLNSRVRKKMAARLTKDHT